MSNAGNDQEGVARRFGPDPSSRFYKLDERILWDRDLKPLEKLVFIDICHREKREIPVPGIKVRANLFGVNRETLMVAEKGLEQKGYLIREGCIGRPMLYAASFPAVPPPSEGCAPSPERESLVSEVRKWMATVRLPENPATTVPTRLPENPATTVPTRLPENPATRSRKIRQHKPENPATTQPDSLVTNSEEKKEKEEAPPSLHPYLAAERFYNLTMADIVWRFHGSSPGSKTREDYIRALEGWISHGLNITGEMVEAAVNDALSWWKREGKRESKSGRCHGAGPVIRELTLLVNPLPEEPPTRLPATTTKYSAPRTEMTPEEDAKHAAALALLNEVTERRNRR